MKGANPCREYAGCRGDERRFKASWVVLLDMMWVIGEEYFPGLWLFQFWGEMGEKKNVRLTYRSTIVAWIGNRKCTMRIFVATAKKFSKLKKGP
jgi:hypothetical protein